MRSSTVNTLPSTTSSMPSAAGAQNRARRGRWSDRQSRHGFCGPALGEACAVPTILIVRHAQASFGAADYDVLSERGHEQAAALAADFVRRGVRIDRVVSGTLRRQRDTAGPIAAAAGVDVQLDAGWDEYHADDILGCHSTSPVRDSRPPGSDAPAVTSAEFQDVLETAMLAWMTAGADSATTESWPAFAQRAAGALGVWRRRSVRASPRSS